MLLGCALKSTASDWRALVCRNRGWSGELAARPIGGGGGGSVDKIFVSLLGSRTGGTVPRPSSPHLERYLSTYCLPRSHERGLTDSSWKRVGCFSAMFIRERTSSVPGPKVGRMEVLPFLSVTN